MRIPVSVYSIVYNCANEVENALSSVREWADEIVCVDSFSSDATAELCEKMGATVYRRAWEGFYSQLHCAEGLCKNDWALRIDADETVSPALQAELLALFANGHSPEEAISGYEIRRRSYVQKRWISGGGYYPSWHLRLFRRSRGGTIQRRIHEKIQVAGKVGRLSGCLDHWCWQKDFQMWETFLEYARTEAEEMTAQGKRVTFWHLSLPLFNFLRRFFLRGAWQQGTFGAVTSMHKACKEMVRMMMAWEMQNRGWLRTPDATYISAQLGETTDKSDSL